MELFFDSHAHYYDERFARESAGADAILEQLFQTDVGGIVNIGTNLENSEIALRQAAQYPHMYGAVGIHPTDGQAYEDAPAAVAALREMLGTAENRKKRKIVALGEIGLDYHYDDTDKEKQAYLFDAQLSLAEEVNLPVIIHDRDAHGDIFDTVCRHKGVRGVFHSYSGSAEMARDLVRRGWYISFSGVVSFKNAPRVHEALLAVPDDRLLIETDAPYLAPHPHRGALNHSGYLKDTAAAIAALKGTTVDAIAKLTRENALRFFSIS